MSITTDLRGALPEFLISAVTKVYVYPPSSHADCAVCAIVGGIHCEYDKTIQESDNSANSGIRVI